MLKTVKRTIILCVGMALLMCLLTGCTNDKKISELIQKGETAYAEENYAAAIEAYSEILKLDESKDEIYNNRGMAYMKLTRYSEAKKDFTRKN